MSFDQPQPGEQYDNDENAFQLGRQEQYEMTQTNHFAKLAAINVNDHTEAKNGLTYLSWAWAVDQLLRADPTANWSYGEPRQYGDTLMVFCTVTAFGVPRTCQLPVMDHRNRAIANPDAFAVNTAMQRCLVKAIALHGLGLYIYAGEDLPAAEQAEISEAQQIALQHLRDAAINGLDALKRAWEGSSPDMRKALASELPALKAAAQQAEKKAA